MAFNTFASATSSIPLSNLDDNFTKIGTSDVASSLYPTATTSITYGAGVTQHNFSTGTVGFNVAGTLTSPVKGNLFYNTDGTGWKFQIGKLQSSTYTPQMTFVDDGNVGIGTSSPQAHLDVSGSGTQYVRASSSDNSSFRGIEFGQTGAATSYGAVEMQLTTGELRHRTGYATWGGFQTFYTDGSERMRITSTGNVGIGTSAPTYKLQLSTDSAAKPSTNTWTIASDERIKNVTGEYTKGLDAVCALRPITYEYNGAAGFEVDGKENISIIAQEAIQHFPECVGTFNAKLNETDETETELYNWNGHALTFALVNAIKELKAELDTVKSELNALKNA